MSTYQDLVDAMRRIQERTGDPRAWQTGLTTYEVTAVLAPMTPWPELNAVLAKIRQQHPEVFNPAAPPLPAVPQSPPPPQRAEGDAAKAISDAEAALAHQNSVTSQVDLQVVSAVLNAHLTTVDGRNVLESLQREIEAAVRTRSDLDTPAGARDFQRYLIGKLRDIRQVVATASLDDTSKAALMAAWTSLYNASKNVPDPPTGRPVSPVTPPGGGQRPPLSPDAGSDPLLDSLLLDDPGLLAGGAPVPETAAPAMPAVPTTPSFGGGAAPGGASMPGLTAPGGLPLPSLQSSGFGREPKVLGDDLFADHPDTNDHKTKRDQDHEGDDDRDTKEPDSQHPDPESAKPESPATGPMTVTLPNGETVTAASPQLAAAIKAAAAGTPIADAFQQQQMTIPQPGTAVASPIDPSRVIAGDIGVFTDRHALALGRSRALLDGQIQHISTVSGPSFLGWEHPPTPASQTSETAPAQTDTPTPTRPAAVLSG
jgi:hypothetical protein